MSGPAGPDPTPCRVTGPSGEPPAESTLAASFSGRGNFTNRIAAHLADVRNSDKAHRVVRSEAEQKLEALQRMVYEQHSDLEFIHRYVLERLPSDLRERVAKPNPFEALVSVLSGPPEEICEGCGDPECPA